MGLLLISWNNWSLKCHDWRFHGVIEGERKHEGISGKSCLCVGCDRTMWQVKAWGLCGALCQVRLPGCRS